MRTLGQLELDVCGKSSTYLDWLSLITNLLMAKI